MRKSSIRGRHCCVKKCIGECQDEVVYSMRYELSAVSQQSVGTDEGKSKEA